MTAARCTNLISRYHGDSHWRRASMIIAVMGRSALRAAIDLATAAIEHFGAEVDRKSTRLNSITNAHLVCRLLLEKKKTNNTYYKAAKHRIDERKQTMEQK